MVSQSELNSVSSRAELERLFEDIAFAKRLCEDRLQQSTASANLQPVFAELNSTKENVRQSLTSMNQLNVNMDKLNLVGENSKKEITGILDYYHRALKAKNLVKYVADIRQYLQGINGAIEMKDFDRAAELASLCWQIPASVFSSPFAQTKVPSSALPDLPQETLDAACDLLCKEFTAKFEISAQQKDTNSLSHCFKQFPMINKHEHGLTLYAKFICQIVAGMSRSLLESSKGMQNPVFFSTAVTKLLENIAVLITQHTAIVAKNYGQNAMPETVIPIVQHEVDKQAGILIDTFWDERKIEFLVAKCRGYSYPELVKTFTTPKPEPKPKPQDNYDDEEEDNSLNDLADASNRLNELSIILNRWSLYKRFLNSRWPESQAIQTSLDESLVQSKITELLSPVFNNLSLFVFRRSFEKSIVDDELPSTENISNPFSMESPLISSVVDDILYVFSNVLGLTFDTGDSATIESSFSGLRRVLESDFIGTMQRKLKANSPTDASSTYYSSASTNSDANAFIIYLNNLQVTNIYVARVVDNLVNEQQTLASDASKQMVLKFKDSFKVTSKELINDGCQTLASHKIAPQTKSFVNSIFKQQTYTQQDSDYSRNATAFNLAWRKMVTPLSYLIHPDLLLIVLQIVCGSLALNMERFIWSLDHKIAENGCFMLDADIHKLASTCAETDYSLKRNFSKLLQMVDVLMDSNSTETELLNQGELARLQSFKIHT